MVMVWHRMSILAARVEILEVVSIGGKMGEGEGEGHVTSMSIFEVGHLPEGCVVDDEEPSPFEFVLAIFGVSGCWSAIL